jgi:hypothetical protein
MLPPALPVLNAFLNVRRLTLLEKLNRHSRLRWPALVVGGPRSFFTAPHRFTRFWSKHLLYLLKYRSASPAMVLPFKL